MSYRDWKAVYIDKSKTFETWQAEFDARSKADENSALRQRGRAIIEDLTAGRLPTAASNAKVAVGALNDKNDPTYEKRDEYAKRYYEHAQEGKGTFVKNVARNSGMSEKAIEKIFEHVFIKEHQLRSGVRRFDSDYEMAESFRRLSEGKGIQAHDMILLRHEWLELGLMNRYGYDYDTAHRITERKYNYDVALTKWQKERGV